MEPSASDDAEVQPLAMQMAGADAEMADADADNFDREYAVVLEQRMAAKEDFGRLMSMDLDRALSDEPARPARPKSLPLIVKAKGQPPVPWTPLAGPHEAFRAQPSEPSDGESEDLEMCEMASVVAPGSQTGASEASIGDWDVQDEMDTTDQADMAAGVTQAELDCMVELGCEVDPYMAEGVSQEELDRVVEPAAAIAAAPALAPAEPVAAIASADAAAEPAAIAAPALAAAEPAPAPALAAAEPAAIAAAELASLVPVKDEALAPRARPWDDTRGLGAPRTAPKVHAVGLPASIVPPPPPSPKVHAAGTPAGTVAPWRIPAKPPQPGSQPTHWPQLYPHWPQASRPWSPPQPAIVSQPPAPGPGPSASSPGPSLSGSVPSASGPGPSASGPVPSAALRRTNAPPEKLPVGYGDWIDWNHLDALYDEERIAAQYMLHSKDRGPHPDYAGASWRGMSYDVEAQRWTYLHRHELPDEYRQWITEGRWDSEEAKALEGELASKWMIPWKLRGPPGPDEGGPLLGRGMAYRANQGKWMSRGGDPSKQASQKAAFFKGKKGRGKGKGHK